MEVKTVQPLGIFTKDPAIGTKTSSQVSQLFNNNSVSLLSKLLINECGGRGGVTTFRVSKWCSLFIFTTIFFTRKSTTFIKQNLQLGFGLNRWKLGATELLWPYKWHGSLPGADPLQLSPFPGSSCCECSCQLYSIHHGQSLYTQWSFCINKSLKQRPTIP